jgi:hypothetical protein
LKEEDRGKELDFMRPENMEDVIRKQHLKFMTEDIKGGKIALKGKINSICESLKEELKKYNEYL